MVALTKASNPNVIRAKEGNGKTGQVPPVTSSLWSITGQQIQEIATATTEVTKPEVTTGDRCTSKDAENQQNSELGRDDLVLRHIRYSYLLVLSQLILPFAVTVVFTIVELLRGWSGHDKRNFIGIGFLCFTIPLVFLLACAIAISSKNPLVRHNMYICTMISSIFLSILCALLALTQIGLTVMIALGFIMLSLLTVVFLSLQTRVTLYVRRAAVGLVVACVIVVAVGCVIVYSTTFGEQKYYGMIACGGFFGMIMTSMIFGITKFFAERMKDKELMDKDNVSRSALWLILFILFISWFLSIWTLICNSDVDQFV